jgi:hypothetical protein
LKKIPSSQQNKMAIEELKRGYDAIKHSWDARWFFPKKLAEVLDSNYTNEQKKWPIVDAFLNRTWFFQRWYFSFLEVFSGSGLISACKTTKDVGLLSGNAAQDNFDAVAKHDYALWRS